LKIIIIIIIIILSASKTIRKAPLTEAQTALGKQKNVIWNAGICPITEIL